MYGTARIWSSDTQLERGPAMPMPSPRPSAASRPASHPGVARASLLSRTATSPAATASPRFTPPANPRFTRERTTRAPRASAHSAVASVQPLSTTITSCGSGVWRATLSRQSAV